MAKTFHLPLTSTVEGLITAILKLYYLKNFVKKFLKKSRQNYDTYQCGCIRNEIVK